MATQGGECVPFAADVTKEATLAAAMEAARARWGRIDILHNNVGVSIGGGDKPLDELHASFSKFVSHRTGAVAGACLGRVGRMTLFDRYAVAHAGLRGTVRGSSTSSSMTSLGKGVAAIKVTPSDD